MKTLLPLIVLLTVSCSQAADLQPILKAIQMQESSGKANPPDGDGGKAIGPMQIHRGYWYDATHSAAGKQVHPGTYQDCRKLDYARQVVLWYWARYCPQAATAGDFETLARCHNGGPSGAGKPATLAYWRGVQRYLPNP